MTTIRSFIRVTLLGVTLISLLTACPNVCPDAVYSFAVMAQFSPQKDSIQVGDTLLLMSSFSTKLTDASTKQLVDYSKAEIGSTLRFQEILTTNKFSFKDAVESFAFVTEKGQIYTDASVPSSAAIKQIRCQQVGLMYELLVGLIPQKKGIYCLTISDGFSTGKPDDGCDSASFGITLTNSNQHLQYLAPYYNPAPVPAFNVQKSYCFKVY